MDATSRNDTVVASDSGLTPSTIPGRCNAAQNGASVENVPKAENPPEWYVFRASYGREKKAADLIKALGLETYVAYHIVHERKGGPVRHIKKPLIPNIVFALLTRGQSLLLTKGVHADEKGDMFKAQSKDNQKTILQLTQIISYYYNHFETGADGTNPPLVIPNKEMENFLNATSTGDDVQPVDEGQFKIGEEVEVVMGDFKGLCGKVLRKLPKKKKLYVQLHEKELPRANEKRRLLIKLPCLGSFSSALIPTAYFRKIE